MDLPSGFVTRITVEVKGLLSCLCLLLVACFTIPAWSQERDWTLEEFVKKLEETGDWPREKQEALLGVKLTEHDHSPGTASVPGPFVYGKELIVRHIVHWRSTDTHETLALKILLSNESSCFTRDRLEKLYPSADLRSNFAGFPYYVYKKSWGEIVFTAYEPENLTKGAKHCFRSIETYTNKYLDTLKERHKNNKKQNSGTP